jgi:hypothetical protein
MPRSTLAETETIQRLDRKAREQRVKRLANRKLNGPSIQADSETPTSQSVAEDEASVPSNSRTPKIKASDITGLKYFDQLAPLLQRLHNEGCERDTAGNRKLHYDQYCMLILLYLFNPIVTSLRGIQQASELQKVQKKLGCSRASLGSLSEATSVFNPESLQEIIAELGEQLQPIASDSRLKSIDQAVTLVDGTLLSVLPSMMEASVRKQETGSGMVKWRLHTHFEIAKGWPVRMDLAPNGGGEHDERSMMAKVLEPDRLYVMDRGYQKFVLFNQIVTAKSSYVCRLRDNSKWQSEETRYRNEAAEVGEIISDEIATFSNGSVKDRPDHKLRMICVRCNPHTTRGLYKGSSNGVNSDGVLRIATNLMDVPADVIALIFSHRWAIEIFFRFFKHMLGCRHLLSHDPKGIEIQTYCAIIACLLISLWTGKKPTLRTYEMICFYFCGMASEDELMAHIEKLKTQSA